MTRKFSPEEQAIADAQRLVEFWAQRGRKIHVTLVPHYGEFLIRSDLTGRETCETIRVVPPKKESSR